MSSDAEKPTEQLFFDHVRTSAGPPLPSSYLALGAQVAGPPASDTEFNTADRLVLLRMFRLPARYARHFLSRSLNG